MRHLPLYGAVAVLVSSGVLHGLRTERWGRSAALAEAAARLDRVPARVGDWEGSPVELDARQLEVADVAGHLSRKYVDRGTGAEVTLLILCGRPAPVSVHEPDVCYTGAGYEMKKGDKEKYHPRGGAGEAWTARFVKPGPAPDSLRIFWSWSDAGPWLAPENPRPAFARSRVLYKLYVVRRMTRPDEPVADDPAAAFLRALLPELERCLAPGP